jgi:hypothetical protein
MTATIAAAEAVGGGGVKGLIYGDSAVNDTSFGDCYSAARNFASFITGSRHLFGPDRVKIADIALFYSVPHRLWIQDSSLSVSFDYRGIPSNDIIT